MKLQGTPEEMEQAKNWWKDQKKRINEEYKETKKKDPNAKKDKFIKDMSDDEFDDMLQQLMEERKERKLRKQSDIEM